MGKRSNFTGVDSLYYAIMTSDLSGSVAYSAPIFLAETAKISVDPSTNIANFFGDNRLQEQAQIVGAGKISLDVNTISLAVVADILGHALDGSGGIVYNYADQPPFIAIFYRRQKAKSGQYRFIKILKCKFTEGKDEAESTGENLKLQNDTLEGSFFPRIYDGNWRKVKDTEEAGYVDVSSTWFTNVDSSDVVAPTILSSIPANSATAVAIGVAPSIVFSEPLAPLTVTNASISIVDSTTGLPVTTTVAYNATNNTATITPGANLTAARKYYIELDSTITDLAGNKLVATALVFTCA